MTSHSNTAALRVLPITEDPAPAPVPLGSGPYGLNTLRAIADFGPSELFELDAEIAAYVEKINKLQMQRTYLTRVLVAAKEYFHFRER